MLKKHYMSMENALYAQAKNKYERLALGIVLQAVRDYREAVKSNDIQCKIECERFFRSEWLCMLIGEPNGRILNRLRAEAREFNRKHARKIDVSRLYPEQKASA